MGYKLAKRPSALPFASGIGVAALAYVGVAGATQSEASAALIERIVSISMKPNRPLLRLIRRRGTPSNSISR